MKYPIQTTGRALCFAAGLVLVSLFSGCGRQGAGEGEIVLKWPTIWVGKDSKAPMVEKLVAEFNEEHAGSIKVEIEPNPDYDGYRNKLNTAIASGQVPDIFVFNPDPTTFQYYEGDLLMDFSEDLKGPWGETFVSGTIDAATKNGMVKSIPYEQAITPIWYNQALFDKAGIDSFPKTFDEFWVACDTLKAAGIVPTSQMTGGTNAWTSMLWYSHIVAGLGGPDVWKKPFSDPVFEKAAAILLHMYQDGNTTRDAVGGDAAVSGGHYLAGDTAIFINGPWYIGRVKSDAPEVYAHTKVTAAPQAPGGSAGAQIGFLLSNLAAAKTDDPTRRAAVVSFMKWMTAPENIKRISMDSGSLFCVKFQVGDEAVDPLQKQFMEAASNATFITSHFQGNVTTDVAAEFGQALGKMALGEATPKEFVDQIIEAAE
ncbi:ABC transporter substrate-binding protein [Sediminispirochaeta smaragdinae]|uniref:Extracellular solute-binding protein family 1 n=1 Tax=Sediminispirochaeta smaragdinae (strain DSM 11293 / JCM 15392 / SEBR 4228) TaxID=573413 RepID=E1RCI7_SEDSS|nr:ABC transporter substrate-binding protein [Sediminispirochaeta smaragdinae]ADK80067.1 extracellular solute-binding protein family 1 [Sediminispirochaeta smaragdinae DSM 11293]